ncbi:MAG: signal protein PDZ [Rhodospirillaceae bacterium]|nr:MAG: signal protein PDZ [Rhodospirillaceae bacterium]
MMIKRLFLTAVFTASFTAQAFASTSCVAPGAWFDPNQKSNIPTAAMLSQLKNQDVIMLGETHDVADHHRWQMQTIAQLYAQRSDMVLGFESFPRRLQPILDKWVAGDLSEDEFIKQSEWNTVWKYDPKLYLPLFHFARINHVPMVALNVDKSLTNKISKLGWTAIAQSERLGLGNPKPPSQDYLDMLGEIYALHSEDKNIKTKDDPHFTNFVDVQVTWDRAMAEAMANKSQGKQMVAIVGRGHLENGYGVPHQLTDLGVTKFSVLIPWDTERPCDDLNANIATAVFGLKSIERAKAAPKPRLGIMIETAKAGGVHISNVVKTSVAEASGLLKDDVITFAAGQHMRTAGDLVKTIQAMVPGTWLPLIVKRGAQTVDIVARFPHKAKKPNHP